jgi:hypothetical protein
MAGHWQGTVWETGAVLYQGRTALDLQIDDDGTWRGKIGTTDASGTARLDDRGWLVLSGIARAPGGLPQAIFYELVGDSGRRWGEIASPFSEREGQGRVEHASVSIRKLP